MKNKINAGDCNVEAHSDGGKTIRLPNGSIITMRNGDISMTLPEIVAVGIKNLGEVASHAITPIYGSKSHVVHFINGGLLQFSYNDQGEVIDLLSENLIGKLKNGNEMEYCVPP